MPPGQEANRSGTLRSALLAVRRLLGRSYGNSPQPFSTLGLDEESPNYGSERAEDERS